MEKYRSLGKVGFLDGLRLDDPSLDGVQDGAHLLKVRTKILEQRIETSFEV